jgi:phenylacetic acid degradation protein
MPIYEYNGKQPDISPGAFVHPDAVIIGDVRIGNECLIAPGVVIRADFGPVTIQDGTSIQDNTVIHVDPGARVIVEQDVIVGHSVVLHDVHIKSKCVIGMGAILLFGVVCEEGAFVGAGSVVPNKMRIPAGKLAAGNPAEIIKDVTPDQKSYAKIAIEVYKQLPQQYQKTMKLITR